MKPRTTSGCEECPSDCSVVTNISSEVLGDGLRSGDHSLRCVGLVLCVFMMRDVVANLVVGFVELVPVMMDVSFPLGNTMLEKGLVGFCELFRLPCVYPAPVES